MMSIRQRIARGAAWTVLYKWVDRGLGFVSTLILAHVLVPADFGLVQMGTSIIALLLLLTYFGLDTALLRQKETTEQHFNAVWTLNVLCGCGIGVLMLASAVPAAHFYREPRVTAVICVLAAAPILQGLENVGVVKFRKDMRFDREFRYMFTTRMVKFVITVFLAFTLRTYWALVIGILSWRAAAVGISYLMQPFRPRFSLRSLGELMHFSKWLMLHNALSFLRDRSSDFVVGRLAGSSSLGLFSVAAEISDMPGTELVAPINRAVLPAYMSIAHDLPALRREYLSVLAMVALLAVPIVAAFAVCAPFLVLLFLGPKWLQTADLIEILAFYGITRVIQSNAYSAYLALGKPQYYVAISFIHVSILVVLQIVFTLLGRPARRGLGLRVGVSDRVADRLLVPDTLYGPTPERLRRQLVASLLQRGSDVPHGPNVRSTAAWKCSSARSPGSLFIRRVRGDWRPDIHTGRVASLDLRGPTCRVGGDRSPAPN